MQPWLIIAKFAMMNQGCIDCNLGSVSYPKDITKIFMQTVLQLCIMLCYHMREFWGRLHIHVNIHCIVY